MSDFLGQLGKLSVGLAILIVVLLIVKALPALVNSFQRKAEARSSNGDAGKKDVSFWIREYEKGIAPVLVKLEIMDRKLDELTRKLDELIRRKR